MKRFAKKVDKVFWLIVSLFPLILVCFNLISLIGTDFGAYVTSIDSFIKEEFFVIFSTTINNFTCSPIADYIYELQTVANITIPDFLVDYLSYCAMVELIHVFFDFIVFIPRLCHKFLGGLYANE